MGDGAYPKSGESRLSRNDRGDGNYLLHRMAGMAEQDVAGKVQGQGCGIGRRVRMKFTVLVITYNSDLFKTYLTLQSVIDQKFEDYEIVIADDGSKENHFSELQSFLDKKQFKRYKLVANEKNKGTVQNLLSGLEHTEGKYVKFISAGDALYDENTLQNVYDFMEENHCDCCFGLIQGYQRDPSCSVKKVRYFHPFDINAYRKKDTRRIVKNLVLYSDNVCGASICYEKDFALEYMGRIQNEVVYEEDIFQVLAAVEDRPVQLYDEYMIWYEIGTGMTTQKHSEFEELIRKDVERFYKELYRQHGDHPNVKKRFQLLKLYRIKNLYLRTVLRFFVNPDALRYFVDSMIQRKCKAHQKETETIGFLEQEDFWKQLK